MEWIICSCGESFLADELVAHEPEETHTIGDWHCPYCGGLDYIETDDDDVNIGVVGEQS